MDNTSQQISSKLKPRKQLFVGYNSTEITFKDIFCSHDESSYVDEEFIFASKVFFRETPVSDFTDMLIELINNAVARQEKVLAERKERAGILINNLNLFKESNAK